MAREIWNFKRLCKEYPALSRSQWYKACRRRDHPVPHKKIGKLLLFDPERISKWFESLPGRDETI